ncbi:MAG: HEAT repeat domain-containing protein [Treponema sp.]|nr:HEAT repeat domain-containing protein [Treponema sp.]MBQ7752745.1 HEAT repeat domain-containing protein [Treponema sp.]
MKFCKKFAVSLLALSFVANLYAQQSEKTVESEYLSSVEDIVITELAASEELDNKLVALQYLEAAIDDGRTSPDMMVALDSLAGEGITAQSRTNGRLMNNYPQVRAQACDLLARVPTEESKTTLKKIALADNEPMVVTAAIRALGEVGLNDGDDVVDTINWVSQKNLYVNPTSSLALEILVAYEKLVDKVEDKASMLQSVNKIAANYNYVPSVRNRAKELSKKLIASSGSNNKKSDAK